MIRESKIEDYLIQQVEKAGGETRKLKYIGRKDAPDRLVLFPMVHVLVELKAPGECPRDSQYREHKKLAAAGFGVWIIDSFKDVDTLIKQCKLKKK
jgi:hypothetical protein